MSNFGTSNFGTVFSSRFSFCYRPQHSCYLKTLQLLCVSICAGFILPDVDVSGSRITNQELSDPELSDPDLADPSKCKHVRSRCIKGCFCPCVLSIFISLTIHEYILNGFIFSLSALLPSDPCPDRHLPQPSDSELSDPDLPYPSKCKHVRSSCIWGCFCPCVLSIFISYMNTF